MPFVSGILTQKILARGQLPSSVGVLYTAPVSNTGAKAIVKELWLSNTDTATRTITLYVVEAGGAVADNRAVMKDITIAAKTWYRIPTSFVLDSAVIGSTLTGDTLQGLSDAASKITYLVSGVELS
jgi:hypothetical protein